MPICATWGPHRMCVNALLTLLMQPQIDEKGEPMAMILTFAAREDTVKRRTPRGLAAGELVPMKHIDLETVVETIRMLRNMDDQDCLDRYNRVGRAC